MTAEFLLEAIGQIDDDLILDAEKSVKRRPPIRQWAGMAAALALCVGLSAPLFFWRTGSKSNAGGEAAPSASGPASGFHPSMEDSALQESARPSGTGTADSSKPQASSAKFFTERGAYGLLRCTIDALPDGCRALGVLSIAVPGTTPQPSTVDADYEGCPVWESADGSTLYLQLSGGNWLAAGLIQAYD